MLYLLWNDVNSRITIESSPTKKIGYEDSTTKMIEWPALEEAIRTPGINTIAFNGPKSLVKWTNKEDTNFESYPNYQIMYLTTCHNDIILTEEGCIYDKQVLVSNMVRAYLEAMKYFDFKPDDICSNHFWIYVAENKYMSIDDDHYMEAYIDGGFIASYVPFEPPFGTFWGHTCGNGLFASPYDLIPNINVMIQALQNTSIEQLNEYHFQRVYGGRRDTYLGHPHHTREWQCGTPEQRERIMTEYNWLCEKLGKNKE